MRSMLFPLFFGLSACGASGPVPKIPDPRLANEIEAKLRTVPCVGSIHHWERHYEFRSTRSLLAFLLTLGTSDRWFDYRTIARSYYQAGFEEFRAMQVRDNGITGMRLDVDD